MGTGFLSSVSIGNLSAAGILALTVLLVLWGRLVPKKVVDDITTSYERQLDRARTEISDWKQSYETTQHTLSLISDSMRDLAHGQQTTEHLLNSIQEVVERADRERQRRDV